MAFQDTGIRLVVLGTSTFQRDVNTARNALTSLDKATGGTAARLNQLGASISRMGQVWTSAVTVPILAVGGTLIAAGIQFEDAFAGVSKTVEGVSDNFGKLTPLGKQLREEIRQLALEIPMSVNELAKLGEIAGALGIQSGSLTQFVKTVAELGVTTNLSAEDAATALAKIGNIMGISADQMGDFAERAGSALVDLGNKSAAQESDIVNMAYRIAGAGRAAGLTTQEIFALATSVSELGINAEAGGTAVSRIFLEMQSAAAEGGDKMALFAKAAGITNAEFQNLVKNSPITAFKLVAGGLASMQEEGKLTSETLADLGLNSIRLRTVINNFGPGMANLTKNIGTANTAWGEATALQIEAQKKFATTKSQLILLRNAFSNLGITIFDLYAKPLTSFISGLRKAINTINESDSAVLRHAVSVAALVAAIGPLLIALGFAIQLFASLSGYLRIGALAFGALSIPMLAIAGVILFVAANFEKIKTVLGDVSAALKDTTFWLGAAFKFGEKKWRIGNVFTGIGQAIKALTYIYKDNKRTFFGNILKSFGIGKKKAEDWGMAIRNFLTPTLTTLSEGFQTVGFWFKQFQDDMNKFGLATAFKNLFTLPDMAFDESTMLRPIERIMMAFGASRETIDRLRETVTTFTQVTLPALAAWAGSVASLLWDMAMFVKDNVFPIIGDIVLWVVNDLIPTLLPVLKNWTDALKAVWDDAKPQLENILDWVKDEGFPKFATLITDKVIPALDDLSGFVKKNSAVIGPLAVVVGAAWLAFTVLKPVVGAASVAFTVLKPAIAGVLFVLDLLLGPIGLILLPLALGAGLILLYTTNTWGFKDAIDKIKPGLEAWIDDWRMLKIIISWLVEFGFPKLYDKITNFSFSGAWKDFKDLLRDIGDYAQKAYDWVKNLTDLPKFGDLLDKFNIHITGGLAAGGPINGPTVVGEKGPELYFPGQSGYIINNQLSRLLGNIMSMVALSRPVAQGSMVNNRSFAPTIYGAPIQDQEQLTGDLSRMYRMATLANY